MISGRLQCVRDTRFIARMPSIRSHVPGFEENGYLWAKDLKTSGGFKAGDLVPGPGHHAVATSARSIDFVGS